MRQRSIIITMAKRLAAGMLCLWLLSMALATCLLAGDLQQQGAAACASALEQTLADYKEEQERLGEWKTTEMLLQLPEVQFTPTLGFPLLNVRELSVWHAALTVGDSLMIVKSEGFDVGSADEFDTGFTVREGRIFVFLTTSALDNQNPTGYSGFGRYYRYDDTDLPNPFLSFRAFSLRQGSFPCAEIAGDYPTTVEHDPAKPVNRGNRTPESLLDAIESRELHFDSHRLLQGSQLRGTWLRDAEGNKRCFILGAYGWSPLLEAAAALRSVYLLAFVLYQLLGVLIWFSFRQSLAEPLRKRAEAMLAEPLTVSRTEYDYRMPYGELRGPIAAGLLRRQMMQAAAAVPSMEKRPAEECPLLLTELQGAEGKLLPILLDRGQRIVRDLKADGRVAASPEQLEDALLALFREVIGYADQGNQMTIGTKQKSGYLLAEIEIKTRHMKEKAFELLWDGIYRSPADGDAPGAKLRKAMWQLPGSFAAVRKTKKGLTLTLGLPKKN